MCAQVKTMRALIQPMRAPIQTDVCADPNDVCTGQNDVCAGQDDARAEQHEPHTDESDARTHQNRALGLPTEAPATRLAARSMRPAPIGMTDASHSDCADTRSRSSHASTAATDF